jgi:hypothetical protein
MSITGNFAGSTLGFLLPGLIALSADRRSGQKDGSPAMKRPESFRHLKKDLALTVTVQAGQTGRPSRLLTWPACAFSSHSAYFRSAWVSTSPFEFRRFSH